jgi:PhzF family phenazine biosynthesis protein
VKRPINLGVFIEHENRNLMKRAFKIVDVFSARPLLGNPVAVVLDAGQLDTAERAAIASWTNLSKTTFVLPPTMPEADYRLRIFAPRGGELPFAGHPTLGSAHALLEAGRVTARNGQLIQECEIGLVRLSVDGEGMDRRLTLDMPKASVSPVAPEAMAELEAALGFALPDDTFPVVVDAGAVWIVVPLADADKVLAVQPDQARTAKLTKRLGAHGISVFGDHATGEAEIEIRCFAPSIGIEEDPVCGGGNGHVGLIRYLRGMMGAGGGSYLAAQGRCVGRDGRVSVTVSAESQVQVGGACVTTVDGSLNF